MSIDSAAETPGALIAYGRRGAAAVVLKVCKRMGDEWHSGDVLRAFGDRGVVRVLERAEGALLLERLTPGCSLVEMVQRGDDDAATEILAGVVQAMSPGEAPRRASTVEDWGRGFDRYLATGDRRIPRPLVETARRTYAELARSQTSRRLLHGDLQHSNVLFDQRRGWVAIDPKGVVGEAEYELGAALRNPREAPALFTDPAVIERRVRRFVASLGVDRTRVVGWAFSQAVLSVIWDVEDGVPVDASHPCLALAGVLRAMLPVR
ncbi:MAG TPA: aminoglycoside phosphotransferase family protein [Gemmatimonadaceae bacterium]|nr:aminoglycoside phosphotransferase family protein [Gemmatimonadaceae bacterium]